MEAGTLFRLISIFIGGILFVSATLDVARSEFKHSNKMMWLVTAALIPLIGPLIYLVLGRKQKTESWKPW